jgi:hypothetical protein
MHAATSMDWFHWPSDLNISVPYYLLFQKFSQNIEKADSMELKYSNHLANETSPYLLQHASNPVDWYPWGEEALEKAKGM